MRLILAFLAFVAAQSPSAQTSLGTNIARVTTPSLHDFADTDPNELPSTVLISRFKKSISIPKLNIYISNQLNETSQRLIIKLSRMLKNPGGSPFAFIQTIRKAFIEIAEIVEHGEFEVIFLGGPSDGEISDTNRINELLTLTRTLRIHNYNSLALLNVASVISLGYLNCMPSDQVARLRNTIEATEEELANILSEIDGLKNELTGSVKIGREDVSKLRKQASEDSLKSESGEKARMAGLN